MELGNIDPQRCAGQLDDRSGKRKLGSRTKLGSHRAFAPANFAKGARLLLAQKTGDRRSIPCDPLDRGEGSAGRTH
jgi:hypothetical protein